MFVLLVKIVLIMEMFIVEEDCIIFIFGVLFIVFLMGRVIRVFIFFGVKFGVFVWIFIWGGVKGGNIFRGIWVRL